jgi:hypothetical protein
MAGVVMLLHTFRDFRNWYLPDRPSHPESAYRSGCQSASAGYVSKRSFWLQALRLRIQPSSSRFSHSPRSSVRLAKRCGMVSPIVRGKRDEGAPQELQIKIKELQERRPQDGVRAELFAQLTELMSIRRRYEALIRESCPRRSAACGRLRMAL